jgi:predicted ATP-dependent serine protease
MLSNNKIQTYDADAIFESETPSENESITKNDTQIITENSLNPFSKFAMTAQKAKELKNMEYVIDGLFVEGYHTYLYGASGSGKTTLLLNLSFEMVERGYTVYFLYLDGDLFSASKISEEIDRRQIQDKYSILVDGTMQDYLLILQSFIDQRKQLQKTVFILDTYKFLSEDVNNKNANKKAMHFIKDVCKLNATFISLGHSNKDGKNQSGTAEIEQDCDALLKIDSINEDSTTISTIQKGGRCRCTIRQRTFEFQGGEPLSVVNSDVTIDVEEQKALQVQEQRDQSFICEVQRLLSENGEQSQKELLEMLEDFGIGKNKMMKMLKLYSGKKWEERKGEKNASIYYPKGDLMKQWNDSNKVEPIKEEKIEPTLFSE